MMPYRTLALVLLIALLVTAVTPGRAEAEPVTILLIVSAAVVIVIVVTYLYVANKSESRRATDEDGPRVVLVALAAPPAESP